MNLLQIAIIHQEWNAASAIIDDKFKVSSFQRNAVLLEVIKALSEIDIIGLKAISAKSNVKEVKETCEKLISFLSPRIEEIDNGEKIYIGLSLSACISSILKGDVKENEVICIISSTLFDSIDDMIEQYSAFYWARYDKTQVRNLLIRLHGVIYQPKECHIGYKGHSIHMGIWFNTSNGSVRY